MTRKMIEETERKLLNRSIVKNYSKRWKQQRIKESKENLLQENLSLADYAKVLALTRKRNFKKLNYKNQHLWKKFEKMLKKLIPQYTVTDRKRRTSKENFIELCQCRYTKRICTIVIKRIRF